MTGYLLGIATVFAVAYLACGVYLAVDFYRYERPAQWVHNGPPSTWNWARRGGVFWLALVVLPVLWPLVIVVLRANSRWNRRRWSRMPLEQRKIEADRFQVWHDAQHR